VRRDCGDTDPAEAYLDIETTGLSCQYAEITVIGMYLVNGTDSALPQHMLPPFIALSI
jgi:uncharacterized protein YprB with RNaseH-like and TPR domain